MSLWVWVSYSLSPLTQSKYLSHDSPCERICWVRLKGPTVNLIIVEIHVPHRARIHPVHNNTMTTLFQLLKQVPNNDCIVLLCICIGDFNEQLQSRVENYTGNREMGVWTNFQKCGRCHRHDTPLRSMCNQHLLSATTKQQYHIHH